MFSARTVYSLNGKKYIVLLTFLTHFCKFLGLFFLNHCVKKINTGICGQLSNWEPSANFI